MKKSAALLCLLPILAAPAAGAAADYWTDREICRVGIAAFLAIDSLPIDHAESDFRDYIGFEAQNGIVTRHYACRVQGDKIALRWFKDDGSRKRDSRTSWKADGDAVVVSAGGEDIRFEPK